MQSSSDYATPLVLTGMKKEEEEEADDDDHDDEEKEENDDDDDYAIQPLPGQLWAPPGDPVKDHPSGSRLLQGGKVGRRPRMCER